MGGRSRNDANIQGEETYDEGFQEKQKDQEESNQKYHVRSRRLHEQRCRCRGYRSRQPKKGALPLHGRTSTVTDRTVVETAQSDWTGLREGSNICAKIFKGKGGQGKARGGGERRSNWTESKGREGLGVQDSV